MHDVGKALDGHELLDLDGAVIADAAEIVAAKIDEHDVLGTLFFTGEQLLFQALIFGFVFAARLGAGDGAVENIAAAHPHEHFRGTAHNRDIVHLQKKEIGRRVQGTQLAVNFKRLRFCLRGKALAEDNLENISCADVLLGFADGSKVFGAAKIRTDMQLGIFCARFLARAFVCDRLLQKLAGAANLAHSGVVPGTQGAAVAASVNISDDPEAMLDVVEGDEAVIEGQHGVVQADLVAQPLG